MAFAETFKALSDPVRREILQLLKNGKMSAGEIGGHFDMTGATISYHLKILKKADLVWETKVKNFVYYELNTTVVEELLLWLSDLKGERMMKGEERKEFLKEYKMSLISGSILTISPSLAGILLWDRLPEKIATHFDQHNVANGWSSKPMAVFGIPFLLLLIHLFCVFFTANDPKRKNINRRIFTMILWLVPVVSVITCMAIYGLALGMELDIGVIVNIMVGIMFIILGNYVRKVKQNYTVGMKLPWTLNSEENWNRTNRMTGWILILSGLLFLMNSLLLKTEIVFAVILLVILVPMIYSFILYKKGI
mgnify:FL=1